MRQQMNKVGGSTFLIWIMALTLICIVGYYGRSGGWQMEKNIQANTLHLDVVRQKKRLSVKEGANAQTSTTSKQLVLVNSEHAIPDNYLLTPSLYGDEIVDSIMYPHLVAMINAAGEKGLTLWVASGYRSEEKQDELLQEQIIRYQKNGMSERESRILALTTMTKPGHSEHHTGLAVDFNTVDESFAETDAYRWLQENAAKYGFVQRYYAEKNHKTGIAEESWHYRYVGREHALKMVALDMCLEEYVLYLNRMK